MTTETIALLTILRDETQSRDVLKRCDKEIARLAQPVTPRAVLNAWQGLDWATLNNGRIESYSRSVPYPFKPSDMITVRIK